MQPSAQPYEHTPYQMEELRGELDDRRHDEQDEDGKQHEQPFEREHECAGGPDDQGFGERHDGGGVTLASGSLPPSMLPPNRAPHLAPPDHCA